MKRKVLFLISQLHKGGAENSLVKLVNSLNPQEYETELIVMNQIPVKDSISLIDHVAQHVRVCDVFHEENKHRLVRKIYNRLQRGRAFSEVAISFVAGKQYDLAVHVGEWWSPNFLVSFVQADRKMVWIHGDIDKSNAFSPDSFFALDDRIDQYLFVSAHSMEASCKCYPFIRGKSAVLHNAIDLEEIRHMSEAPCDCHRKQLPLVVTLANIRTEKGHLRSVEVMKELKRRGRDLVWWNIGHSSVEEEVRKLKAEIEAAGLEDRFFLLGALDNPYPLLKQADVLACLSDFESWSLVITEARCLGVPVVATRTSGAIEQIQNGKNGYLTAFDPVEIADALEKVLFDSTEQKHLRHYLAHSDRLPNAVEEFSALFGEKPEMPMGASVLFVIDDVNFPGGAHAACFRQIAWLRNRRIRTDIYSSTWPNVKIRNQLPETHFFSYNGTREQLLMTRSPVCCLWARDLSLSEKKQRVEAFLTFRRTKSTAFAQRYEDAYLKKLAENYDAVCVLSEGSKFKRAVAESTAKTKIQWIHTDYSAWRKMNAWTLQQTKDDEKIWDKMDRIVVLSEVFRQSLSKLYPHLRNRIFIVGNLQPDQEIKQKAQEPALQHHNVVCLLSSGENEKECVRILETLLALKKKGLSFCWVVVGVPFALIRKYPQLEDSVTCIPAMEGLSYDRLLENKDVLFCETGTDPVILHVAQEKHVIVCTMDSACTAPVRESHGWRLPREENVVAFLEQHSIAMLWDIKEAMIASEEHVSEQTPHPVRFVSCFRFEPVKNVAGIIRVLGRLHICGIPFEWVFVGNGEQFDMAREMVRQYGLDDQVLFVGWQANAFPFIINSDVFVQFSNYEGLPNTIYEALILGKPVLSSNVGAVWDQLIPDENGWLIEPTEQALFEALLHIALHKEEVQQYQKNLDSYVYQNDVVEEQLCAVFDMQPSAETVPSRSAVKRIGM